MTEDHIKILEKEMSFLQPGSQGKMFFKLGAEEVLNNPEKYNLVDADVYIEAVEGRKSFRESLRIERLESNRLAKENTRLKNILSGLVTDVGNLLGQHDIEWQQAGYFNEAKELLKGGSECKL